MVSIFTFGRLSEQMKIMALQKRAQDRMRNPTMAKGLTDTQASELAKQIEDQETSAKVNQIVSKLKSGQVLSGKELAYLKEKSPALYEKALAIQLEREEYKEKLKRCRTKEDVQRLNSDKTLSLVGEAKAVERSSVPQDQKLGAMEMISWRMAAITNEHCRFVQTADYQKLPTEAELRKKEKKWGVRMDTFIREEDLLAKLEGKRLENRSRNQDVFEKASDGMQDGREDERVPQDRADFSSTENGNAKMQQAPQRTAVQGAGKEGVALHGADFQAKRA